MAPATDPFDLERFVVAQERVYPLALSELQRGRKTSHWMWFVFPQLRGLGSSPTAIRYAIRSSREAQAYLAHPVLGERLRTCATVTLEGGEDDALMLFGSPDDLKFRSSLTLFDAISSNGIFARNLARFFDGAPDPRTLQLLGDPA